MYTFLNVWPPTFLCFVYDYATEVLIWSFLSRNNEIKKEKKSDLNLSSHGIARLKSRNYDLAVVIN